MSLHLYVDLLNIALDQANVDLLALVWRDSLVLDKTSLKELNNLIVEKIPSLRQDLGMPQVNYKESFPEFVRDYDEHVYTSLCDKTPKECLLFFAYMGDLRNMKKALKKGANVSDKVLYEAARGGSLSTVAYLLENNDLDLNYGLEGASHGGNQELIDYFLEDEDIDLNCGLRGAARGGNRELVDFFISKGADNWNAGLIGAAASGSLELVEFFITQPPSGRHKGVSSVEEAAAISAKHGHLELVKFFLSDDERVKSLIGEEYTINEMLLQASENGHLNVVKFLVKKGANLDDEDMYQIGFKGHAEVIFYLLDHGIEGSYIVVRGAAEAGNEELVTKLMHWISSRDNTEELDWAIEYGLEGAVAGGHSELVKYFSKEAEDFSEYILFDAINRGRVNIVRVLLEKLSSQGDTVETEELEIVARTGNVEMAKLLLEFGGSPKVLLEEARRHENKVMEELALSYL